MNSKTLIWMGVFVGGAVGGYVPVLFGAGALSMASLLGNTIGSLVGIWLAYKFSKTL